jgi:hypothetical protein
MCPGTSKRASTKEKWLAFENGFAIIIGPNNGHLFHLFSHIIYTVK